MTGCGCDLLNGDLVRIQEFEPRDHTVWNTASLMTRSANGTCTVLRFGDARVKTGARHVFKNE